MEKRTTSEDHVVIVCEDNHALAASKQPGVPTQSDKTGDACLIDLVKRFIAQRDHKPGNVFLTAAHRIDRPASGLVLMAKTSKGASRLSAQMREGKIEKTYLAAVEGKPEKKEKRLEGWIVKNAVRNTSRMVNKGTKGAKFAALEYEVIKSAGGLSLLAVRLETGRSHQVRVQLANEGWPVAGDRRYGAKSGFGNMIALHSCRLVFTHPTTGKRIVAAAPPPARWADDVGPEIFAAAKEYLQRMDR